MSIIIVEGVDRVGKTTLVNKIVNELNYKKFKAINAKLNYRKIDYKLAKIVETEKLWATVSTLAISSYNSKVIFDRFHISEYVYGHIDRGYMNVDCLEVDKMLAQLNAVLIFVHPVNIKCASAEHGSDLSKHYAFFKYFVKSITSLKVIHCNYNTADNVVRRLTYENSHC